MKRTSIGNQSAISSTARKFTTVLSLVALMSPLAFAATVTVPFATDFDTYTAGSDVSGLFVETNNGTANSSFIDAGSGNIVFRQTLGPATGSSNTAASVTTSTSAFIAGGGFELTTSFTLDSFTVGSSGIINTSLNALSSNSTLSLGYRLTYTLSDGGSLVLTQDSNASNIQNIVAAAKLAPVAGSALYTLTLRGVYTTPTSLNLFGSISNGTSTSITTATDNIIPATSDNFFGVRSAAGGSSTDSVAQFTTTSLSLASVPEPSGGAIFALGALVLLARRRI